MLVTKLTNISTYVIIIMIMVWWQSGIFCHAYEKRVSDGLGRTIRFFAARARLPYALFTPAHLFHCGKNIFYFHFIYCTAQEHSEKDETLKQQFQKAETGRYKIVLHLFLLLTQVKTRKYSVIKLKFNKLLEA